MSFTEDFKKLQLTMPRIALQFSQSENSEYTNYAFKNKNCYLVFGGHYNEDSYHDQYTYATKDCVDCDRVEHGELSYECSSCSNIYNCDYCSNCHACSDCAFGFDLVNCRNCFLCAGLRNVEYHILNKPYAPADYAKETERLTKAYSVSELSDQLEKLRLTIPHVAFIQKNCENCLGSFLQNCKNCFFCSTMTDGEDCLYMMRANAVKNCVDCDNTGYDPSELLYECIGNSGNTNCNFCFGCWHNSDLEYCELVFNSHNCFGCISRQHAEYEILNVKYPKEQWFKRVAAIRDELRNAGLYGKWLLPSTYPYEDTIAPLYFGSSSII